MLYNLSGHYFVFPMNLLIFLRHKVPVPKRWLAMQSGLVISERKNFEIFHLPVSDLWPKSLYDLDIVEHNRNRKMHFFSFSHSKA